MSIRQIYATIDDLGNPSSKDLAALFEALELASEFVRDELGSFIPFTQTRKFNGRGATRLYMPSRSPLLSVTSITNDDDTLAATDYILQPDGAHWPDGPYSWLEVDPDAEDLSTWLNEPEGVIIAGTWGMYNRTESTGATVQDAPQTDSQTTLLISDGSKLSPGMSLLVGSEQELVTGYGSASSASTTLSVALGITDDSCTFADGTKVNKGEILKIGFEDIKLLDIAGNTGYLDRGYNQTTRAAHNSGVTVNVYRTFAVDRGVNGTTAAEHAQSTAISRYLVPRKIHYLTLEIATLGLKKAESNYAGRTGNVELGQVFYHDVFPMHDIRDIKKHFFLPKAASR